MNLDTTIRNKFTDVDVDKMSLYSKISLFADKCLALASLEDEFIGEAQLSDMKDWIKNARQMFEMGYADRYDKYIPDNVKLLQEVCDDIEARVGFKWGTDVVDGRRGKFTRRLGQALKDAGLDKTVVESYVSEFGDVLGSAFSGQQHHVLDATSVFDWSDGDFGDGGSCFWDDMSYCRRTLEDQGAFAFRLFGKDGNWSGDKFDDDAHELITNSNVEIEDVYSHYARCWAAVDVPAHNTITCFNVYGINSSRMARVLAAFTGLEYRKCYIRNTDVYINSYSFVLANKDYMESVFSKDAEVNLGWYSENDEEEFYD